MNQPGTKHASAEPTRVENKRERRRGAAGRAAVLRRAPSDSDCSGETASLSADSGDRVVRPQPPPPRSGKSRSRRRGSEWEVLEGLKDGQRFEKRPDVFNGYLHKKRKWPLKGWHKRFFVIDGGILVYARSPTDVARGRLHGSVDVGLSVISAKARRRRIDIDADEFIYHLRAKTPDVFRTWLNVLKAHRLYRQHLLTFGARESVPKIHAPLDDMPPTDTSSRTSSSATDSSQINYHKDNFNLDFPCLMSKQSLSNRNIFVSKNISVCHCLADQKTTDRTGFIHNKRLCSMNCAKMLSKGLKNKHSPDASQGSTDGERQMHASDLNSLKIVNPFEESSAICKISLNSDNVVNKSVKTNEVFSYSNAYQNSIHSKLIERKQEATTSFSIFTHNAIRSDSPDSPMRRSKKSTNLVKYRNYLKEPTLKRPLSNCMLLTKYKLKVKHIDTMRYRSRAIACEPVTKVNNEIQVNIESKEDKGIQYEITGSECNRIAEQLMISLFDTHVSTGKGDEVKYYVNQIVKDLYEIKRNKDLHPVKAIFRTLLEYWLKNTSISQVKEAMTRSKSISKQSNRLFTKDECLSSCVLDKTCKQTQYHGFSELKGNKNKVKQISNRKKNERRNPPKHQSPKRDTASFEKERRIQELERLLKNTVYMCDAGNNQSLEKDIKITKTLIDNLGKLSRRTNLNKSNNSNQNDASNSSAEVPKIQDTIDRLISETSLPPDVAKDFFNAYLGTLLHDSSKSVTITSTQSSDNIDNTDQPDCDVQVETVTRRLSKSVLTSKTNINKSTSGKVNANFERIHPFDDGQQYLKDMLDKITTIFSKIRNSNNKWFTTSKIQTDTVASKVDVKDELGRPVSDLPGKNLIHHDYDENSVVIDLTRYDLEHIAMFSDPAVKGNMSVTIKLKEKPINTGIRKRKQLSLKFSDGSKSLEFGKENNWTPYIDANDISRRFNKIPIDVNKNSYIECPANDLINLKPYLSSSEATSKACRIMHESDHSLNLSFKSSRSIHKEMLRSNKSIENEGTQSCFIMSTLKKHDLRNKVQSKKKVRLKECHGAVLNSSDNSLKLSITGQTNEARPIYEKSEPSIIDEKFIFLMLNNLSLLSRNAPSLNKDIKNLYLKLKTKYEQVLQNDNNVHGLSLLGKIYTEESSKLHNEKQTQTDIIIGPLLETCIKVAVSVGTNTNKILANRFHNKTSIDKDRSNIGVETEEMLKLNKYEDDGKKCTSSANVPQTNIANNMASNVSTGNEMKSTERGTSNPDWFKRTKECGINTALRYIFNNNRSDHLRIAHAAKTVQLDREFMKKNKNFSPKLLPSSFNISMQSETYWKSNTSVKETEKEFKSYQLFLDNQYPVVKLSSLTTSCTKEGTSDDLKTLYRCSSDPSYCSGLISPTSPPIRGPQFVSGTPGGRLASWIIESGGPLENASRELGQAQLSIQQMQRLLDALEMQQQVHHDTDIRLITKVEVDVL